MPLAQLNIAQVRFPLDDARMVGFVEQLADVNAGAEAADGFIWRCLLYTSPSPRD